MAMEIDWVLPAGIPFADLKGRDLEECVYWLFDSMGAKELEWRTGGSGGGTADGGRDLEATFYVPTPDGEMEPQCWWIECKGRKHTVEPEEVRSAVNNSTVRANLAYLVIVTNSTFSNPTRDWVKQWQLGRPLPRVKLWDRETLERLLSRHPNVVLRLFSEALSSEGLLRIVEQRFWERLEYAPVKALRTFWDEHDTIEIEPAARFALTANEFAHGSINDRPWIARATPEQRIHTLHIAFFNLPYLVPRVGRAGIDQQPVFAALAHLIIAALQVGSADTVVDLLINGSLAPDGNPLSEEVLDLLLAPVIERIAGEMQDVCSSDCERVLQSDPTTLVDPDQLIDAYWRRLDPVRSPSIEWSDRHFWIEQHDGPCKVGFALDREHGCPLFQDVTVTRIRQFLAAVERVSGFRLAEARGQALARVKARAAAALRNVP